MIVMPADHVIEPAETFLNTVRAAVAVIEDDPTTLITFGIKPTRPETGYGYIERGELLETREGVPVNRVDPVPREARPRDRREVPRRREFRLELRHLPLEGPDDPRRARAAPAPARGGPGTRRRGARHAGRARRAGRGISPDGPPPHRQGRHGEGVQRPGPRGPLRLERRRRLARPGHAAYLTTRRATPLRATSSPAIRPTRSSSPTTAA